MDGRILQQLAEQVNGKDGDLEKRKRKINALLHQKSSRRVIMELKDFLPEIENKRDHGKAVLIVVFALLRRKLSDAEEIECALSDGHLMPVLYGGLMRYLTGNSDSHFALRIRWTDGSFSNRYEFLRRFYGEFYYYEHLEVFYAAEMISRWSPEKFEILVWKDQSRLILLNVYSHHVEWQISQQLMKQLAAEGDELQAAVGFAIAAEGITGCIRRQKAWELEEAVQKFQTVFDCAGTARQVVFLVDFLLIESAYPTVFGYWLLEKRFREELLREMTEGKKLRSLKEVCVLTEIISRRRNRPGFDLVRNKDPYYQAITERLWRFVKERTGIYLWERKEIYYFKEICKYLPKKYQRRLEARFVQERQKLMTSELDQLVRFHVYLKDENCRKIVDGMLELLAEEASVKHLPVPCD